MSKNTHCYILGMETIVFFTTVVFVFTNNIFSFVYCSLLYLCIRTLEYKQGFCSFYEGKSKGLIYDVAKHNIIL